MIYEKVLLYYDKNCDKSFSIFSVADFLVFL